MKCMFQGCKILEALPDISKWNTSNVNDMRSMFFNCEKIIRYKPYVFRMFFIKISP